MSAVLEAREPSARFLDPTQPQLVQQFGLLATAPGGVARLRELILTLAVQGKLVPQIRGDEPADRLLARVRAAKRDLAASGRISRDKPAEPVSDDEASFLLPTGWVWCRLGDLAWPQAGFAFKSVGFNEVGQGSPLIRIRDVGSGLEPTTFFSGEHRAEFLVERGQWLISMDGEFRVRQWHATTALLNQRVTRLVFASVEVHADFVATALQRELTALQGTKAYTTVDHLSGKQIAEAVIALPPTAEQARIVARVDELMRLCDALEAKGWLEAEQHARLIGALLGTLTDSTTPEELAASWQRVAEHFDLLLDRPAAVDALEQTILQLAVRGLLVLQDVVDEPAADLAKRIRTHREDEAKAGRAKLGQPHPPVAADDAPHTLPHGWEWIRFDELIEPAKPISYGVLVPGPEITGGVPFVRIADLSLTNPAAKPEKSISAEVDAQYLRTRLVGGEILMGVVGSIGKLGVAPMSWAGANIARAICRIVPVGLVNRDFVLLLLQSEFMRSSFAGDTRTLAQPTLNVGLIRSSPTPLPPVAEQARIVARVDQLRSLCADLRHRLNNCQSVQSRLTDALVEQAAA